MFYIRICIVYNRWRLHCITKRINTIRTFLYHWKLDINGQHNVSYGTVSSNQENVCKDSYYRNSCRLFIYDINTDGRSLVEESGFGHHFLYSSVPRLYVVCLVLYPICQRYRQKDIFQLYINLKNTIAKSVANNIK
ncbi:unnamed protein product, partial [Medioppia subpectinata]